MYTTSFPHTPPCKPIHHLHPFIFIHCLAHTYKSYIIYSHAYSYIIHSYTASYTQTRHTLSHPFTFMHRLVHTYLYHLFMHIQQSFIHHPVNHSYIVSYTQSSIHIQYLSNFSSCKLYFTICLV